MQNTTRIEVNNDKVYLTTSELTELAKFMGALESLDSGLLQYEVGVFDCNGEPLGVVSFGEVAQFRAV